MQPELTNLETAELWITIIAAGVTIVAIVIGGGAAFWRFVIQQPYGNKFDIRLSACRASQVAEKDGSTTIGYTVTLLVENQSAAAHKIAWWRRLLFPEDVGVDYDPDDMFIIHTDAEACDRYGGSSTVEGYSLAPGEIYSDQIFKKRTGRPAGVCYIEYTVRSDKWWWRGPEFKSQILTTPVEYDEHQHRRSLLDKLGLG